jgi:hypothetical protein
MGGESEIEQGGELLPAPLDEAGEGTASECLWAICQRCSMVNGPVGAGNSSPLPLAASERAR